METDMKGREEPLPPRTISVQFNEQVLVSKFNKNSVHNDLHNGKELIPLRPRTPDKVEYSEDEGDTSSDEIFEPRDHKGPKLSHEERTHEKAGQVLELLQDETDLANQPDIVKQMQSAHLFFTVKNKFAAWEEEENPTAEYLHEKEVARLEKIKQDRGACLTNVFDVLFHVTVCANFVLAWIDSCKIIVEEAKFQILLLKNEYNCLEIIITADWLDHIVNISHALMSACVLFADSKSNAGLCIAYVLVQAVHTSFKSFEFFLKLRYEQWANLIQPWFLLIMTVLFDVVTSIVVIQRFYDLTDRVRARARFFATTATDGKSMNDDIIYQNQSSFLQRKHILREAIASQVFTVIRKIDNYKRKGLEPDHVALYRELHAAKAALEDVDGVDNQILLKELKKANAQRLKEFDMNPSLLEKKSAMVSGSMSKLFKVNIIRH